MVKNLDAGDIYIKSDLSLHGTAHEIFLRASELIFLEMIPRIIKERPIPSAQTGDPTVFKRRIPAQSKIDNSIQTTKKNV